MAKGFRTFLLCLLAFAVAVGAFCILYPLTIGRPAADDSCFAGSGHSRSRQL